eukprot:gene11758-15734_t
MKISLPLLILGVAYSLSNEQIEKWKLWPGLITTYDWEKGSSLIGFEHAMDIIWNHQHPIDCKNAKFLIAEGWAQGFGSEVHVLSIGFALALNLNRIFVMNPEGPLRSSTELDNKWQTNNSYCKSQGKITHECYYEPWTNCSIDDILGNISISELKSDRIKTFTSDTDIVQKRNIINNWPAKTILMECRGDVGPIYPQSLLNLVNTIQYFSLSNSWWFSISAAYLLRPNQETIAIMNRFRKEESSLSSFNPKNDYCISLYVRKGDKHIEMKLPDISVYLNIVENLINPTIREGMLKISQKDEIDSVVHSYHSNKRKRNHNLNDVFIKAPLSNISIASIKHAVINDDINKPFLFIGSEDPKVISETINWTNTKNWGVLYTNLFDRNIVSAHLNWTQQKELKNNGKVNHHDYEYLSMIYNLDNHLRCRAFTCAHGSNFCRIISELRSTVAYKANYPMVHLFA